MVEKCFVCEKTIDDTSLIKCPVCFRYTCFDHSKQRSGRSFCSKSCGDYFFFADDDD